MTRLPWYARAALAWLAFGWMAIPLMEVLRCR